MKRSAVQLFTVILLASAMMAQAQQKATSAKAPAPTKSGADENKNLQAYVQLLRSDINQQKVQVMGAVMQLGPDESAKFWPIYRDYSNELAKVNDLRVANIKEYAANYNQMTDDKADELVQRALDYQRQRSELLARYYGIMKQALGATNAARFLQVESQLLLILDLQLDSELPIVGPNS